MNIAIMTDTNSGISPKRGEPLGIKVIPMPVLIDGKVYYEGVNLTAETFYQWLRDGREVTTSQPPPGEVLSCWDELFAEGFDEVLYIPMSSGLSTSFQTAFALAEDYEGRVQVVDHRSVSVPLRYALEDAQNLVRAGRTALEIKTALEAAAQDTIIYIGVDTLKFLRRGGRITPAAAAMGNFFQIKPLLQIHGERLDALAKVRGTLPCRNRLIEEMQARVKEYQAEKIPFSLGAAGTFSTKKAEREWRKMVQKAFPKYQIRYDPLTFSIGSHTGPEAFGMAISRRLR